MAKKVKTSKIKHIHRIAFAIDILALVAVVATMVIIKDYVSSSVIAVVSIIFSLVFAIFMFLNFVAKWRPKNPRQNIILLVSNLAWLVVVGAFIFFAFQAHSAVNNITDDLGCIEDCAPTVAEMDKPMTIYLSGEDSYGETDEKSLSDVNQLVIMNPEMQRILMVNTPRDYYVKLHSFGPLPDKLTHAGIHGVEESMNTLGDLYDIEISYYVKINFSSLMDLVDILGGITVDSEYEFTDVKDNHYVVGPNELDSYKALWFSRERVAFSDGDNQRGKNQQKVLEAILAKMRSTDRLADYQQILDALSQNFKTNILGDDIQKIMQSVIKKNYIFETISATGVDAQLPTYSYPNLKLYVMEPDQDSVDAVKAKIHEYLDIIKIKIETRIEEPTPELETEIN